MELQAIALSVKPGGRIGQAAVDRRIATRHERLVSVDNEGDLGGLRAGSGIHAEAVGSDAAHLAGDGWLHRNAPTAAARWPARGGPQGRERQGPCLLRRRSLRLELAREQADLLRAVGAAPAASSDGVFNNLSNFHTASDEDAYYGAVVGVLGAPSSLGAVVDTSRDHNGAPADGEWWDPAGRKNGRSRR
nr:hypothetical protein [Streptomyces canus]